MMSLEHIKDENLQRDLQGDPKYLVPPTFELSDLGAKLFGLKEWKSSGIFSKLFFGQVIFPFPSPLLSGFRKKRVASDNRLKNICYAILIVYFWRLPAPLSSPSLSIPSPSSFPLLSYQVSASVALPIIAFVLYKLYKQQK